MNILMLQTYLLITFNHRATLISRELVLQVLFVVQYELKEYDLAYALRQNL
jgi:hypothetical protein